MNELDRQKLELLDGTRRAGDKSRAAVRRGDLAAIVSLKPSAAKKAAGASVTVAEFDALVADFSALRDAIDLIAAKVKA